MSGLFRALQHETVRLFRDPRWLGFCLVALLSAVLASGEVYAESANTGLAAGAFDVHAAASNNLMYLGYLLFTAFVFVVGDTVIADVVSGYADLARTRHTNAYTWWFSKLFALVAGAFVAQALFLVLCLLVGVVFQKWTLSAVPSAMAAAPIQMRRMMLFPLVATTENMAFRQVAVACYIAIGFSALAGLLVALSVRATKRVLPVALAFLGLMADYVLVKVWDPWFVASPGVRLMEGIHARMEVGGEYLPLQSSLIYIFAMFVIAAVIGAWQIRRAEL